MADDKLRRLGRAAKAERDSSAAWRWLRDSERAGQTIDAVNSDVLSLTYDSPSGRQPTNFWVFANGWAVARFPQKFLTQERNYTFQLYKPQGTHQSSVVATVDPLAVFNDVEWDKVTGPKGPVLWKLAHQPARGEPDDYPSNEEVIDLVKSWSFDPATVPTVADALNERRCNPKTMTYSKNRMIKVRLPLPKGNFSGKRDKRYPFVGETVWVYHLSGAEVPNFEKIHGLSGIGILFNQPFAVKYAKVYDFVVYAQRDGLLPEVVGSADNPWKPVEETSNKKFIESLQKQPKFQKLLNDVFIANIPAIERAMPKLRGPAECARCKGPWDLWMVSEEKWNLVGKKWQKEILCWNCYRELTKNKGGATKYLSREDLIRRADKKIQEKIRRIEKQTKKRPGKLRRACAKSR